MQEKDNLECKLEDMRATLQSQKADNSTMEDLLAKVQEDKRRLGVRVNKLVNNGENPRMCLHLRIQCMVCKYRRQTTAPRRSCWVKCRTTTASMCVSINSPTTVRVLECILEYQVSVFNPECVLCVETHPGPKKRNVLKRVRFYALFSTNNALILLECVFTY